MRLSSYNRKTSKGFTIVELVIVMAITAIIATITLTNYRAGEKSKRVSLAADGVINALTLAKTYTLSGKNTNNTDPLCRVPKSYWVVFFPSTTQYFLTALNNCGSYDTIETYNLPVNTRFQSNGLKLDSVAATSVLQFVLTPPYAVLTAHKDGGPETIFTTATITLESTDGPFSKTVTVDGVAGRIGL